MKIILIITLFLLNGLYCYCCNCFGPESLEEDFENSEYVFEGTITASAVVWVKDTMYPIFISKGILFGNPNDRDSVRIIRYTIEIEKTFKGKITSKKVFIYSGVPSLECGFPFKTGQKYIVLASKNVYVEWSGTNEVNKSLKVVTSDCGFTSLYDYETSKILKHLSRQNRQKKRQKKRQK